MSSLTCVIDYQGKNINNCKTEESKIFLSEKHILLSVNSDYDGKFLWAYTESKFILLIGSAFSKEENIGLIRTKSQLEHLHSLIIQGIKPENLLTGFYNIILVDTDKCESIIHNSHFGLRPLFYSLLKDSIVISTNPESIIKTGLVEGKIQLSTALQFFLFNYPVNEDTIFKNVYCIPNGSRLLFSIKGAEMECYFDSESLITKPLYNYKDSVKLIHESFDKVLSKYSKDIPSFSLSLTGGWDGRLLLSLLSKKNVIVDTYSHGSALNPDVTIPQFISKKLGINYTPYILNDKFYNDQFLKYAIRTINMAAGLRSVTRAHYLFSIGSEMNKNDYILTGIGGSELMKGASNEPGSVINAQILKLIYEPDFQIFWDFIESLINLKIAPAISFSKLDIEYLKDSLFKVHLKYHNSDNLEKRLFRFILNVVERKYFGTEIMTYSNLGENLSTYIDIEFLETLSKTPYFGAYMPIGKRKKIFTNWRNSLLYANIINSAFPELGKIRSDKGVSLYDLSKMYRWPWIAKQQIKKRLINKNLQHYDHSVVLDSIVLSMQDFPLLKAQNEFLSQPKKQELTSNIISFAFWANNHKQYL